MKYLCVIISIFLFTPIYSQSVSIKQPTPNSILQKVYEKLKSLKTFRYDITRELNYPSNDYLVISKWAGYYDFSLKNKPIPFRYQIEGPRYRWIYNGIEAFELNKSAKTFEIQAHPQKASFEYFPFLYNSVITLKNALPLLIADKNAQKTMIDTLINHRTYKLLTINMGKRKPSSLGDKFKVFKTKRNFILQIMINPANDLPMEILQKNDINQDFIKTSFTNFDLKPIKPLENSWAHSSYTKAFKAAKKKIAPPKLLLGAMAPNWKLKRLKDGKTLSLSDLKGKVVLIDFWEKNCGHCLASVPDLIKLKEQLKPERFELVGINVNDTKEKVAKYVSKRKINYPVLLNGQNVAQKYGVTGFPRFFVIDKVGKVISSHVGFGKSTISAIKKAIKKAL